MDKKGLIWVSCKKKIWLKKNQAHLLSLCIISSAMSVQKCPFGGGCLWPADFWKKVTSHWGFHERYFHVSSHHTEKVHIIRGITVIHSQSMNTHTVCCFVCSFKKWLKYVHCLLTHLKHTHKHVICWNFFNSLCPMPILINAHMTIEHQAFTLKKLTFKPLLLRYSC